MASTEANWGRCGVRTLAEAPVDDIAKAIIDQLQADGRRSYAAIGKSVGMSEAAVRQRVLRLVDAGVMQIVAVTDPLMLGFARQAMIGVRADGDPREVADKLATIDEIDYVVLCAGSYDILVELVCADDDDLLALVGEQIRAIPGIRATETFVYLRLIKQTYTWGTR
ncbi:MAG: Lrp/AsnC family transcriptional regulator [Streptosporangiales bacterium]